VCGGSKSVSSRSVVMVMSLVGSAAPIAAFMAITETAGGPGLHRRAQRQWPERSGGRWAAAILFHDAKRPSGRGGK
jgi:hypothetical protein